MFCGECGAENPGAGKFCTECGKPLGGSDRLPKGGSVQRAKLVRLSPADDPRAIPVSCANCGASIQVAGDDDFITCEYCNSSLTIGRGVDGELVTSIKEDLRHIRAGTDRAVHESARSADEAKLRRKKEELKGLVAYLTLEAVKVARTQRSFDKRYEEALRVSRELDSDGCTGVVGLGLVLLAAIPVVILALASKGMLAGYDVSTLGYCAGYCFTPVLALGGLFLLLMSSIQKSGKLAHLNRLGIIVSNKKDVPGAMQEEEHRMEEILHAEYERLDQIKLRIAKLKTEITRLRQTLG